VAWQLPGWKTQPVEESPRYEPINIPRPVWWLILASLCLLFAMLFLFAMLTYSVNPATDCDPSPDGLDCEEIPGAPVVFASAAAVAGVAALGSLGLFLVTGGLATLPWIADQLSSAWQFMRRRVRVW
jgi:hypothetical protein